MKQFAVLLAMMTMFSAACSGDSTGAALDALDGPNPHPECGGYAFDYKDGSCRIYCEEPRTDCWPATEECVDCKQVQPNEVWQCSCPAAETK
jgi:hypothetical protein